MIPNSQEATELVKFFGVLATALAAIIGGLKIWGDVQRSKTSLEPSVNKEMVLSMHEDSRVRREYMEQMNKVLLQQSETMSLLSKNHYEARSDTDAMHRNTHALIGRLENAVSKDLGDIKNGQQRTIEEIKQVGKILTGQRA